MAKKIVGGILLAGLIGILIAGGIIRTMDKTDQVAATRGQGGGEGRGRDTEISWQGSGLGSTQAGSQGRGRGGGGYGSGAESGQVERLYPNYETLPEEWMVLEGIVVQSQDGGEELVVKSADGEEVTVGAGPGYMEAQGFVLEAGEQVQVHGYWVDGEFKAARVTRLRDGETISLRDEFGRPAWSGAGRRAVGEQASGEDTEPGQGGRGQGRRGRDQEEAPLSGWGVGQALVDEWLIVQGTVTGIDVDGLVVQTTEGQEFIVENRPWWFVQEQGFSAEVGDEVELVGFYEADEYEVGQITNVTSGQIVPIREENGRPLWAGGGRRGG